MKSRIETIDQLELVNMFELHLAAQENKKRKMIFKSFIFVYATLLLIAGIIAGGLV